MRPNEIGDGSLEREREVPGDGGWNPILGQGEGRDVGGQGSILVKSSSDTRVWTQNKLSNLDERSPDIFRFAKRDLRATVYRD